MRKTCTVRGGSRICSHGACENVYGPRWQQNLQPWSLRWQQNLQSWSRSEEFGSPNDPSTFAHSPTHTLSNTPHTPITHTHTHHNILACTNTILDTQIDPHGPLFLTSRWRESHKYPPPHTPHYKLAFILSLSGCSESHSYVCGYVYVSTYAHIHTHTKICACSCMSAAIHCTCNLTGRNTIVGASLPIMSLPGAGPRQTWLAPTRSRAGWESNCTAVQVESRVFIEN